MISERKILILKTGNTIKSLLDTGKDFEHWFTDHSGLCKTKFMVRSLHLEDPLVDLRQVAGIIITGSPAYVTDKESWNFTGAEYVRRAHKSGAVNPPSGLRGASGMPLGPLGSLGPGPFPRVSGDGS